MNPQEEWALRIVRQPCQGARCYLVSAPVSDGRPGVAGKSGAEAGVVRLESAIKALGETVPRVECD